MWKCAKCSSFAAICASAGTTTGGDTTLGLTVELTKGQQFLVASLDVTEEVSRRFSCPRDEAVATCACRLYGSGRLLVWLDILVELTIQKFWQRIGFANAH